jgi:hypothetical protein
MCVPFFFGLGEEDLDDGPVAAPTPDVDPPDEPTGLQGGEGTTDGPPVQTRVLGENIAAWPSPPAPVRAARKGQVDAQLRQAEDPKMVPQGDKEMPLA